jgi:hypothetical protein
MAAVEQALLTLELQRLLSADETAAVPASEVEEKADVAVMSAEVHDWRLVSASSWFM